MVYVIAICDALPNVGSSTPDAQKIHLTTRVHTYLYIFDTLNRSQVSLWNKIY